MSKRRRSVKLPNVRTYAKQVGLKFIIYIISTRYIDIYVMSY